MAYLGIRFKDPWTYSGKIWFVSTHRDPYIIHLNIALSMVVSPYVGGKSHVLNAQNASFKEPCIHGLDLSVGHGL